MSIRDAKILVIDDDEIILNIFDEVFSSQKIKKAFSGEEGLDLAGEFLPDIIVLDSDLKGMDGYETCKRYRQTDLFSETPILFLSSYTGLEERLKAYDVGADDFVSKPVNQKELEIKVNYLLSSYKHKHQLKQELQDTYNTVLSIQTYAANLQSIGRFLMANLSCHNIQDLCDLFIKTVKELQISCVIGLYSKTGSAIASDTGSINRLEEEILGLSDHLERIHPFGNNRAIFNWKKSCVLVRNIGDNADIIAILMDGLEAGIRAIEKENELLGLVSELENNNHQIKDSISNQFSEMKESLADTFLSLGMVSSLDQEEEEQLNDCVENYHGHINKQLEQLHENNSMLSSLINRLRESDADAKDESDPVSDSIDFF